MSYSLSEAAFTYPRYFSFQKAMKDVLVGEDGMPSQTIEEGFEHPLPSCDKSSILLGLALLNRIVTDSLLGRDWGDDKRWVELDQGLAQGLELGITVSRLSRLFSVSVSILEAKLNARTPLRIT